MDDGIITFDDFPYNMMKFVDLINESEEMKWKILDYHNQEFVLNSIVDSTVYTVEGHKKFLASLPTLKRKHYIVYFDNKPIGKYSFDIDDCGDKVTNAGNYLFYESDLMSGMGFLMVCFFYRYVFEVVGAKEIHSSARNTNNNSISIGKRLGMKVVKKDKDKTYAVGFLDSYLEKIPRVNEILVKSFSTIYSGKA